jgi:hypothetical protein
MGQSEVASSAWRSAMYICGILYGTYPQPVLLGEGHVERCEIVSPFPFVVEVVVLGALRRGHVKCILDLQYIKWREAPRESTVAVGTSVSTAVARHA